MDPLALLARAASEPTQAEQTLTTKETGSGDPSPPLHHQQQQQQYVHRPQAVHTNHPAHPHRQQQQHATGSPSVHAHTHSGTISMAGRTYHTQPRWGYSSPHRHNAQQQQINTTARVAVSTGRATGLTLTSLAQAARTLTTKETGRGVTLPSLAQAALTSTTKETGIGAAHNAVSTGRILVDNRIYYTVPKRLSSNDNVISEIVESYKTEAFVKEVVTRFGKMSDCQQARQFVYDTIKNKYIELAKEKDEMEQAAMIGPIDKTRIRFNSYTLPTSKIDIGVDALIEYCFDQKEVSNSIPNGKKKKAPTTPRTKKQKSSPPSPTPTPPVEDEDVDETFKAFVKAFKKLKKDNDTHEATANDLRKTDETNKKTILGMTNEIDELLGRLESHQKDSAVQIANLERKLEEKGQFNLLTQERDALKESLARVNAQLEECEKEKAEQMKTWSIVALVKERDALKQQLRDSSKSMNDLVVHYTAKNAELEKKAREYLHLMNYYKMLVPQDLLNTPSSESR